MCLVNKKGWKKEGNRKKRRKGKNCPGPGSASSDASSFLTYLPTSYSGHPHQPVLSISTPLPIHIGTPLHCSTWMWWSSPGQLLLIMAQVLMTLPGHQGCTLVPTPGSQTPASWKGNQKIMLQTKLPQTGKDLWNADGPSLHQDNTWSQHREKIIQLPNFQLIYLWKEVKNCCELNNRHATCTWYFIYGCSLVSTKLQPRTSSPSSGTCAG